VLTKHAAANDSPPPPPSALLQHQVKLHPALAALYGRFAGRYATLKKPRHLQPLPALGHVVLEVTLVGEWGALL
jgi:hypothetical protein